ncbi:hypothetical protein FOA52_010299 [Chlamydomonas sp. UWO 241]|nr:hypothetical protein FOA52_010299 [Chlamydomonas sp. UWO 241]
MGSAQLCDIWRDLNPAAMAFTHWSASTSSGKRLDRFLVSECFSPALTTAALPAATALSATSDILPSAPVSTDHLPVSLMVTCMTSGVPRGRGILSFPLRLLNSKEPSAAVSAFIVKTVPPLMVCPASELIGAFDAWKSAFIDMAVGVDKRHRRDRQAPARAADHCARSAREGMLAAAASGGDVGAAATIWLAQKDNAAAAWRALSALAWDVAATLDQNKGETSSYYFHHQAREMHTVTTMLSLNRPGRAPTDSPDAASFVSDAPKATKYVVDFFSSESSIGLFRPQLGIDPAAQHTLLTTLPRRLDGPFAALAEGVDCANDALAGMLTAEELQVALSHAARGKVPGGDGIPYEVYRHWRGSLSPLLLRVFNTGFGEAGRTSPTPFALLLRGVVCLLSKPGKPGDELDGYRPITLLNSDVKLVMSIIANRLQVPLDYLIDIGQGAFIHGRDISHNVRYHLALAARFRDLGLPGWLVHSDLTKAYDTVNRGWLDQAMIRMGFRPNGVVRWCRILLGGAKVRVRVNGFFTPDFPMDSGLFQGSALSCMEWVTDPPFETLAHTFLDCPAARPAMLWLCDTWAALTGGAPPPLTAAVMLADDMSGWSGAPVAKAKKKELRAWTRLRVTVIGAIWRVRCDRQASGLLGDSLALRAVRLALDSVTGAIRRDWQRTEEDITMVDDGFFCVDWWRGFDAERDKDWFCSQWATPPLLCAVLAAPGATTGDTTYTLDVRVGVVGQVPLPA